MIISGTQVAKEIRANLAASVEQFKSEKSITPCLTVVLVGEDPASQIYVRNKVKQTNEVGMTSNKIILDTVVSEAELVNTIKSLNEDNSVHGILVQLPLPPHINEQKVIATIAPEKDVDGFHVINTGKLCVGENDALVPCTPQGCIALAKHHLGDDLSGQHAVIIGRSNIVGKPLSMLFLQENCTVTVAHSKTKNLPSICQQADILVAAVGRPQFVKQEWVSPGTTVIDVGINRIEDETGAKIVGDVDFDNVQNKVSGITPVPGGVGPLTIAYLLQNTLRAAITQNQ